MSSVQYVNGKTYQVKILTIQGCPSFPHPDGDAAAREGDCVVADGKEITVNHQRVPRYQARSIPWSTMVRNSPWTKRSTRRASQDRQRRATGGNEITWTTQSTHTIISNNPKLSVRRYVEWSHLHRIIALRASSKRSDNGYCGNLIPDSKCYSHEV